MVKLGVGNAILLANRFSVCFGILARHLRSLESDSRRGYNRVSRALADSRAGGYVNI